MSNDELFFHCWSAAPIVSHILTLDEHELVCVCVRARVCVIMSAAAPSDMIVALLASGQPVSSH